MADENPQILMPQVVAPAPGAPMPVTTTLSREMHRSSTIGLLGAVVATYGFVEGSKPAKWIGIGAAAYGAWSWWRAYQQNKAVVAAQQAAMVNQAQTYAGIVSGAGTRPGMINGPGPMDGGEPAGVLPGGRPLRSVP